jgi:predicted RNase H-like HicB family nuclease
VEKEIKEIKKNQSSKYIEINRLLKKNLSKPLGIIVEPDADGFIARTPDLPIYGFGDDIIEAIDALKAEIESLYEDLMEDDDFTKDWLSVKKILNKLII